MEAVDEDVAKKESSIQNIEITIRNAVKIAKNEDRSFYSTKLRGQTNQTAKLTTVINAQKKYHHHSNSEYNQHATSL